MYNIYQFSFYTADHYYIKKIPTLLFYLSLQGTLLNQTKGENSDCVTNYDIFEYIKTRESI